MTEYKLISEEPVWEEHVYDEDMVLESTRNNGVVELKERYQWIEANDRDQVLKLKDFPQGEEIIQKLSDGTYENLEEAEKDNRGAEICDSPY